MDATPDPNGTGSRCRDYGRDDSGVFVMAIEIDRCTACRTKSIAQRNLISTHVTVHNRPHLIVTQENY